MPRIWLLKKSAPRLTGADFAEIDAILAEYRQELHTQDPTRWGELNTRLHDVLMSRAEQPRTLAIVTGLLQQTDRYTRLQLSLSADSCRRAEDEHEELVRLCKTGEVRAAAPSHRPTSAPPAAWCRRRCIADVRP